MDKADANSTAPATEQTAAPVAAQPVVASGQPRNFLAVMLLACFLGTFGFHKIYTGDKTLGWTRFGVGVGSILLSFIPFINILASIALLALAVWAIVDVFIIFLKNHTDAEGQEFVATERDKKAAKAIFIYVIASWSAAILLTILIVILLVAGVFGLSTGLNSLNNEYKDRYQRSYDSSLYER